MFSVPAKLAPVSFGGEKAVRSTSNARMGQAQESLCLRCGTEGAPCGAVAGGRGPGGRFHSREPHLGKGCEGVHGEGYPTDKDPQ